MAARFFCDHCGAEVRRKADRCAQCGRYFAFVRCPQCGFSGEEDRFTNGCPVCGYCTTAQNKTPHKNSALPLKKPALVRAGKLPLWVYGIALLGLIFVGIALYLIVR